MADSKDPAIKLFGKTIPLPETLAPPDSGDKSDSDDSAICLETNDAKANDSPAEVPEKSNSSSTLNDSKKENRQSPEEENAAAAVVDVKSEEEKAKNGGNSQEKVLKKPDKVLPCPRCNSLDTKFCYYNNYNVNQPRHFCKNCQRYWTAGGTMRNVPVGAGRRKNKHSASQYRHIMMSSDGISGTQVESPDSVNSHQIHAHGFPSTPGPINGSRKVLKFGPDIPLCESMAAVLNLGEQKRNLEMGFVASGENKDEPPSSTSSNAVPTCRENGIHQNIAATVEQGSMPGHRNGFAPHPLQCYHGPPWPYPWNSSWNIAITAGPCSSEQVHGPENDASNPVQWASPSMVAARAICPPSIPIPIVHPSYWGCLPAWNGGAWTVPWIASNGSLSPSSSNSNSGCSGNGSPTLGKHSRDTNSLGEEKAEKCLWVPKTLRIDDPDDAAKSSIWATLGIKPDQNEPIAKGGIFKAFQSKADANHRVSDAAQVLQANPAALSRSQTFQENT
ncbi:hypothetical protein Syun_017903 [Stephania yunnanensis]|uniref:Dof-type domain-containing protein n=1 Tax=Stephania yunnanensis TaxID=152371 RepID=A0AAP0JA32_9MAGN